MLNILPNQSFNAQTDVIEVIDQDDTSIYLEQLTPAGLEHWKAEHFREPAP
jgi:hypothetical protein